MILHDNVQIQAANKTTNQPKQKPNPPKQSKYFQKGNKRKLSDETTTTTASTDYEKKKQNKKKSRSILKCMIARTFSSTATSSSTKHTSSDVNANNDICSETDTDESEEDTTTKTKKDSSFVPSPKKDNDNEDTNSIISQDSDTIPSPVFRRSSSRTTTTDTNNNASTSNTNCVNNELVSTYIEEEITKNMHRKNTGNHDTNNNQLSSSGEMINSNSNNSSIDDKDKEEEDEKSVMIFSDSSIADTTMNGTPSRPDDIVGGTIDLSSSSPFQSNTNMNGDTSVILSHPSNTDTNRTLNEEEEALLDANSTTAVVHTKPIDLSIHTNDSSDRLLTNEACSNNNNTMKEVDEEEEDALIYSELKFSRCRKSMDGTQTTKNGRATKKRTTAAKKAATKKPRTNKKTTTSSSGSQQQARQVVTKPRKRKNNNSIRNDSEFAIKILSPIRERPSCVLCASCPCNNTSSKSNIHNRKEDAPSHLSQTNYEIEMSLLSRISRLEKHAAWYTNLHSKANREMKKFRSKMLKLQSEQLAKHMLENKRQRPRFLPDSDVLLQNGREIQTVGDKEEFLNGDKDKDTQQVVQVASIVFGDNAANKLYQPTLTQMLNKPQEEGEDDISCIDVTNEIIEVRSSSLLWDASSLKCSIEPLLSKHKLDSKTVEEIKEMLLPKNDDHNLLNNAGLEEDHDDDDIQPPLHHDNVEETNDHSSSNVVVEIVPIDTIAEEALSPSTKHEKLHLSNNEDDKQRSVDKISCSDTPLTLTMSVTLGVNSPENSTHLSHSSYKSEDTATIDVKNSIQTTGLQQTGLDITNSTTSSKQPGIECNSAESHSFDQPIECSQRQKYNSNLLDHFNEENDGHEQNYNYLSSSADHHLCETNTSNEPDGIEPLSIIGNNKDHELLQSPSCNEENRRNEIYQDIITNNDEDSEGLNHLIHLFGNDEEEYSD